MQKKGQEKKKFKRGLSTIVITLIIILISLVAVGIIWVVVRNVIQSGTEGIALGQFTLGADIINVNVDNSSNNVSLSVKRSAGEGEIAGIKFIFSDETDSEIITEKISMNKLEEKRFTFHLTKLAVSKLISISIVPVLSSASGKETLGSVLSKYNVQEGTTTSGSGASCVANCTGKVCGNDGCGGSCGTCTTGTCNSTGSCVANPTGTVYYIDFTDGNDANNGLTKTTAWKTIPGTRTTDNTDWMSASWGGGTISTSNKVTANTIFKLKRGTTHDSSNGGYIFMDNTFYYGNSANLSNPISFEIDPAWGSGSVTFDATGIIVPESFILIRQVDGIKFDGIVNRGIIVQNSPLNGIKFKSVQYSTPDKDPVVRNLYFYNNGNSATSDLEGSAIAGLHFKSTVGGFVSNCEFNGNHQFVLGFYAGESHFNATNLTVSNCVAYNHKGDVVDNDAGIGFKAHNGIITYINNTSFDNLKGFDLGQEGTGDNYNIKYVVINNLAYNNYWGINFNNAYDNAWTGKADYYLINNIIRDNIFWGSGIYAGPYNLYAVHNTFENNGFAPAGPGNETGSISITPNYCDEQTPIIAHLYNNIFYKPGRMRNYVTGYIGNGNPGYDTNFTLDSDYNSWIQNGTEDFAQWAYNACTGRVDTNTINYSFQYGANGPGHSSGAWYIEEGEPNNGLGHYHADANSKGTGATDTTLPPFTNVANNDFTLTAHYAGTSLSSKPWYISEMGVDRAGNTRTSWDIGAYEYH